MMDTVSSKRIPILDMNAEIADLKPRLMQAIESVLDRGSFIMGPNVKTLEQEAAEYLGVNYAVTLNSGTDALVIALLIAGIGAGDEVITTPFTFFATAEAISQVGATPIFVDIDERSYNIDIEQLENAITPRTKAVIPVHLYGLPVEMTQLSEIAAKYELKVIEDVAQAFGAKLHDRKVGTFGDIGCFSFFPSKNLGAYGDGGLLVTDNSEFAERAAILRAHGSKKKYENEMIGFNSRLDEIQAAILRVKLPHIDEWNEKRRQAADRYNQALKNVSGIILPDHMCAGHVYHQYTIRVLEGKRSQLQAQLENSGISTMIYYPIPLHKLPVYESAYQHVTMPIAERLSQEVLSLPIGPYLTASTQEYITQQIIKAFE